MTDRPILTNPARPAGQLLRLVAAIDPWDDIEAAHQNTVLQWIGSGAPLYRIRKPDVPDMHLVSYFVARDPKTGTLLLVNHCKAGLWLPAGGHVEPGEDPWTTVTREAREELDIDATPSTTSGDQPFFITVARTRGEGAHTDVSLWYVIDTDPADIRWDEREFSGIRWATADQILGMPPDTLDPNMHRFVRKLMDAEAGRAPTDLDAEDEPARWCCNGNAEGCPLCNTATLPYPWICPGHPDTAENRARVLAATEATDPAGTEETGGRTTADLEAAIAPWRRKAVRRAIAASRLQGVVQAVTELANEQVTNPGPWGDGYREALSDLRELLETLTPSGQPAAGYDGPSVTECRDNDRRWPLEREGS